MSDKPTKKNSLLDEVADLPHEMTVAEASVYLKRGFEVLTAMAEDTKMSTHDRMHALKGLESYYTMVAIPEMIETNMNRAERSNNRAIDTVRKLRPKKEGWEGDDAEE